MAHCALHLTNSDILFPRPIERWFWSDRASIIREYRRQTATQKHSAELRGKNMAIFPSSLLPFFFFGQSKSNKTSPGLRSVMLEC